MHARIARAVHRVGLALLCLAILWVEVDAAKRGKGPKQRHNSQQSRKNKFQTFRYVALFFFIFLVTPVLFTFVNALRRDPAVPQLARAAFDEARRRSVSFLGRQDPAETLSATVPGDDGVASTAPPADASLRQRAPQAGAPLT